MILFLLLFSLCKIPSISSLSLEATVVSENVSCTYFDSSLASTDASKECIQLCCAPKQRYVGNSTCTSLNGFDNQTISEYNIENSKMLSNFSVAVGKPCIDIDRYPSFDPTNYPNWTQLVKHNGSIATPDGLLHLGQYCLNPTVLRGNTNFDYVLLYCDPFVRRIYIIIGMWVSVFFIVVTLLVYAVLPELRNAHGISLMCYLIGLIVGYSLLAYVQAMGKQSPQGLWCRVLGSTIYYGFMSAFFWLNVISFDLWKCFRHTRTKREHSASQNCTLLIYSIYAWGVPLLLVIGCTIIDLFSNVNPLYKPEIGVDTCFINRGMDIWYYYLPFTVIVCINSVLFFLIAFKIHQVRRQLSAMTASSESRLHQPWRQENFKMFTRLFCVMGVTWTLESLSRIIGSTHWAFNIADFINTQHGVIIFVGFVLKANVRKRILIRWNQRRGGITSMATVNRFEVKNHSSRTQSLSLRSL